MRANSVPLPELGVLRARGPEARAFLQGQLSNDLEQLSSSRSLLAGYHNPQGRTLALLRLIGAGDEEILAVLPRELLANVAQRLGRFILRAKVKLEDASAQWQVTGELTAGGEAAGEVRREEAGWSVQLTLTPARRLWLRAATATTAATAAPAALREWRLAALAAGAPQVYAATSETFVAQMLNLDVLGAIDFEKGCYTGQEVIARAHYRGRVKRRMQRFLSTQPAALQPGERGRLGDGRTFQVVRAATHADGRCEFLAVCALPGAAPEAEPEADAAALAAESLPLPYALPE